MKRALTITLLVLLSLLLPLLVLFDLFLGNTGHGAPRDVFDLFGAPFGFMYLLWMPVVLLAYSKRPLMKFIAFAVVLIHWIGMVFVLGSNSNDAVGVLKIQFVNSVFGPALWIVGCWITLSGAMVRRIIVTKLWSRFPDIESWRV